MGVTEAVDRAARGDRLTREDARALYASAPTAVLGRLADDLRRRKHPDGIVTYIIASGIERTIGLRVTPDDELAGLDQTQHAETAYQP